MGKEESFLNKINPVMRLKIATVVLVSLSFVLLLSALNREQTRHPGKEVKIGTLYTVAVPYGSSRSFFGNTSLVFTGEYSNPETMIIIDPQLEALGEFMPLDSNPMELESHLLQTLSLADLYPKAVKLTPAVSFEYSMMPALEFSFTFDEYEGICYFFMAREYSFTVACIKRNDVRKHWSSRNVNNLAFLQLGEKYRNPIMSRPIIDSATISYSAEKMMTARGYLSVAHRLYESRGFSTENLTRSIAAFQHAFRIMAEVDETNLISKKDSKVFFDALDERSKIFNLMRSEIHTEYKKGNIRDVKKQLAAMKDMASLDCDNEWREWAKRQNEQLAEKETN